MAHITFVIGGVRSGKSSFALAEASLVPGEKVFIATAEALDRDMSDRITRHKAERGREWHTVEEPVHIPAVIRDMDKRYGVALIDCLTLWVSNLLGAGRETDDDFERLLSALEESACPRIYVVSNEVGMGIVPDHPLGRIYRDQLGLLNKMVARLSTTVILMVAGIPVPIKKEGG